MKTPTHVISFSSTNNLKIASIKFIRQVTGLGLKGAKELFESYVPARHETGDLFEYKFKLSLPDNVTVSQIKEDARELLGDIRIISLHSRKVTGTIEISEGLATVVLEKKTGDSCIKVTVEQADIGDVISRFVEWSQNDPIEDDEE